MTKRPLGKKDKKKIPKKKKQKKTIHILSQSHMCHFKESQNKSKSSQGNWSARVEQAKLDAIPLKCPLQ